MNINTGRQFDGHDGKVHRIADYRGKVVVVFFGYTHCPDVCPTTMGTLNKSLALLGAQAREVQVLFVTLDPDRDTVEVLQRYVTYFNPAFVGLRADREATLQVANEFKVYFSQQSADSRLGYTIDHSAGAYVFDRKGILRLYLEHGQKPEDIGHDLGMLLAEK